MVTITLLLAAGAGAYLLLGCGPADTSVHTAGIIGGREVSLGSQVLGRIAEICCREGDQVHAGQLVVTLDSRDLAAALAEAAAEAAAAQVQLSDADFRLVRTRDLARKHFASQQDLDDALAARNQADAAWQAAQAVVAYDRVKLDEARIICRMDGTLVVAPAATQVRRRIGVIRQVMTGDLDLRGCGNMGTFARFYGVPAGPGGGSSRRLSTTLRRHHHGRGDAAAQATTLTPWTGVVRAAHRLPIPPRFAGRMGARGTLRRTRTSPDATSILAARESPGAEVPVMTDEHKTHFGYQEVPAREKAGRVQEVFDSVADRYDVMNDLMSCGIHRLWKRFTVELSGVRRGQRVLDLAAGTGDLAARFAGLVGPEGEVVLSDINAAMLGRGRDRMANQGLVGNLRYVQANAEQLPFPDASVDCVSVGFGLRNVTHKERALSDIYRVLKPGGRLLVLEFSHPRSPPLRALYDLYSFWVLPLMGRVVARDAASYRYLAESIRMHPDQEGLKAMMEAGGFERCDYFNLTGGIVAVHRGFKL